jgi:AcrR family transcriptional regulator
VHRSRKGEQTRAAILDVALDLAAREGLEGLTIGVLAERTGMSKSGVFSHFGSREDIQIAVIKEYHRRFEAECFTPVLALPRGLPRLRALFENWLRRVAVEIDQGCIYISGAAEYDDRPGPVRNELAHSINTWRQALLRAGRQAVEQGHLQGDPEQFVFEMYAIVLALHHDARFLKLPGSIERAHRALDRLIQSCRLPDAARLSSNPPDELPRSCSCPSTRPLCVTRSS